MVISIDITTIPRNLINCDYLIISLIFLTDIRILSASFCFVSLKICIYEHLYGWHFKSYFIFFFLLFDHFIHLSHLSALTAREMISDNFLIILPAKKKSMSITLRKKFQPQIKFGTIFFPS